MNIRQKYLSAHYRESKRSTLWVWIVAIAALTYGALELGSVRVNGSGQYWLALPLLLGVPAGYWLLKQGRPTAGGITWISAIALQTLLSPWLQSGPWLPNALASLVLMASTSLTILPRRHAGAVLGAAVLVTVLSIALDVLGSASRPPAALLEARWSFSLAILSLFVIFFAQDFLLLDLRTKIATAILGTVGIAILILVSVAIYQGTQTIRSLTTRLDASVRQVAEGQLTNTASAEATRANHELQSISDEVAGLAQNWSALRTQQAVLAQEPYWDARTRLHQLEGGQYGNSATDPSSVFVPAGIHIDEEMIADLNVSAYLDFSAPAILENRPSLLAIYAIDTRGVTRYYPNIDLASIVPPDFDATRRPYFSVASPLFNPHRLPRWSIPYEDATGGGLVVTVAAPVYEGDAFVGVIAADLQLSQITERIASIQVGETGYAFMIDDAGRILSMPPAGYEMFGLDPGDIGGEDFFRHTLLGVGTDELQTVTMRMTAGASGLLNVAVNGADTYISFHPLRSNGYSIALVAPASELQRTIYAARSETQQQIQAAVRLGFGLLILLLLFAVTVSLSLANVIAAPIQRLTQAASQVTAGDLTAQASVSTTDEFGTLARAFNSMTSRLRDTLNELEQRVQNRTAELSSANERIQRRARQFEAVAHIARTISSTRDLDVLLSQIASVIHQEFGFYHVGIFLLDKAREYAVLSAANSEGGQKMLARGHRLKVGETGLVGFATGTGKPRVALDTGSDAMYFDNPDLPETRSELALPLRVGEQVIGALDVQSTEPNAFLEDDIAILSTLADQVSIAIQNAQQFEETTRALNESDILARQFVQTGWQEFTKTRNLRGIHHTGARSTLLHQRNGKGKPDAQHAANSFAGPGRQATLSLPIILRGEVIGSVQIRMPDRRTWDQDELDIVTAIIERAAIALENARLLADSQKRAAKERIIGEISSKISLQSELHELLKTTARELGRSLPGAEVAIQFNKDTE